MIYVCWQNWICRCAGFAIPRWDAVLSGRSSGVFLKRVWCVSVVGVCVCVCVTTSLCGQDVGSVARTTAGTQGSVTQENQDTLNLSLQHNPHNENYTSPLSLSLRSSLISCLLLPLQPCLSPSLYLCFCPHLPCVVFSSPFPLSLLSSFFSFHLVDS